MPSASAWTLGAWCRMREDFRNFRVDHILEMRTTAQEIAPDRTRDLRLSGNHGGQLRL